MERIKNRIVPEPAPTEEIRLELRNKDSRDGTILVPVFACCVNAILVRLVLVIAAAVDDDFF